MFIANFHNLIRGVDCFNGEKNLNNVNCPLQNIYDINVSDMDAPYVQGKKPKRHATPYVQCISCLSPSSSFVTFDVK